MAGALMVLLSGLKINDNAKLYFIGKKRLT